MTVKEIKQIATEHGVPEVFQKGENKQRLLQKIDSFYSCLLDHAIISDSKLWNEKEFRDKRDNLRKALNIS